MGKREENQPIVLMEIEPLVLAIDTIHVHSFFRHEEYPKRVWTSVTLGNILTIHDWYFEWQEDHITQYTPDGDIRFIIVTHVYKHLQNPPQILSEAIDLALANELLEENDRFTNFVKGELDSLETEPFRPTDWQGLSLHMPVNRLRLSQFECHGHNHYHVDIRIDDQIILWSVPIQIGEPSIIGDSNKRILDPTLRRLLEQMLNMPQVESHAKGLVAKYAENHFQAKDWGDVIFMAETPGKPRLDYGKNTLPEPIYFA